MFVPDLLMIALLITLGVTLGAVIAIIFFVRRQRQALVQALAGMGKQQIVTAQQLADAIAAAQRQQRDYEQQLQNLAQAMLRLRQEMQLLSKRSERETAEPATNAPIRVLH